MDSLERDGRLRSSGMETNKKRARNDHFVAGPLRWWWLSSHWCHRCVAYAFTV